MVQLLYIRYGGNGTLTPYEFEGKKQKHFDLYERDGLDKGMFSKRLDEINLELDRF